MEGYGFDAVSSPDCAVLVAGALVKTLTRSVYPMSSVEIEGQSIVRLQSPIRCETMATRAYMAKRRRREMSLNDRLGLVVAIITIGSAVFAGAKWLYRRPLLEVIGGTGVQIVLQPGNSRGARTIETRIELTLANEGSANDAITSALVTIEVVDQVIWIGSSDISCLVGDSNVAFPIPVSHDSAAHHVMCQASRPLAPAEVTALVRGATAVRYELSTTGRTIVLRNCIERSSDFWQEFVKESESAETTRQFLNSRCED
jgi:hypothetical protein